MTTTTADDDDDGGHGQLRAQVTDERTEFEK